MSINCFWGNSIHISYNPKLDRIEFCHCPVCRNVIESFSLEEYKSASNKWELIRNASEKEIEFVCGQDMQTLCEESGNLQKVEVGIQMLCNLNCKFCFVKDLYYNSNVFKNLTLLNSLQKETLEAIKGRGLKTIRLTDRGEPFFKKEETYNYIKSLNLDDCQELEFTSNGTRLDSQFFDIMSKSPINFNIGISLNAFSREKYKEIMKVDAFDQVLENIRLLKEYMNSHKNLIELRVSFVLTNEFFTESIENVNAVLAELEGLHVNLLWDYYLNESFKSGKVFSELNAINQRCYKFTPIGVNL